jgi:DNA-binding MarR family transcriptional regulator
VRDHSPESIASTLELGKGLGFLVRLLDRRFKSEYERLTAQAEITPSQFGALLTLHQQGTLTLTQLARHIRIDRSTLGELINRMEERSLVIRSSHGNDRRLAKISLATMGKMRCLDSFRASRSCKPSSSHHSELKTVGILFGA